MLGAIEFLSAILDNLVQLCPALSKIVVIDHVIDLIRICVRLATQVIQCLRLYALVSRSTGYLSTWTYLFETVL